MSDENPDREDIEETLRSIADEVGRAVERAFGRSDVDELAESVGIDPDRAREWMDTASGWLRAQVERLGAEAASQAESAFRPQPAPPHKREDPLDTAGPHPLDLPTEEQGLALAALNSGRWTVEPGSNALAASGEGPGPSDALGLARELHVRDWIAADGEVTMAGRHALSRWLDAASRR